MGLAYFGVGAENGVHPQVWVPWLLSAVLVDVTAAVAEERNDPFATLSLEMVYRGLYFFTFTSAYQRGEATAGVPYLAADAVALGLVTRQRKPAASSRCAQLCLTLSEEP